ncbi:hypothetical protein [Caminicella sporogenes]|uniref:hypothetical protein n=1 Tax=Caminicella sporogenes TaxID=166485 RepID=UPI0025424F7D|nr:hypothetical protein [Caminicella sporogenes]WIF95135.1 hypothetical protein QNI18_00405 [Caminicella sporogenes]
MDVKWKSDKQCYECKKQLRKEIIAEIQNTAGCKKCKRFNKINKKDLTKNR